MAQTISLSYNRGQITFSLPERNFLGCILPESPAPCEDVSAIIEDRLSHPTGGPCLEEFVAPGDRCVIVVSDITRYSAAELFLPRIIQRLNRRGIGDDRLSILFALGIHRPMTSEEQRQVVGEAVSQRIRLLNHDCCDRSRLVCAGATRRGNPVVINRAAAEADKLIVTGTIGLHYLAGFGGGRKSILPGISSFEACAALHLLSLDPVHRGRHARAQTGVLEGNPLQEEMLDACTFIPPAFLFNTVLAPDHTVLQVVAGDMEAAFSAGCRHVTNQAVRRIAGPADLVIVSAGGYPKDITFIQAHKSLEHAVQAVRPGGVMICAAACCDGIGNPDFLSWFRFSNIADCEDELHRNFQINGQTAYSTLLKAQRISILLLSELPDTVVRTMSMTPVHSMDEALAAARVLTGPDPSTYVIPYGGATLPWISTQLKVS